MSDRTCETCKTWGSTVRGEDRVHAVPCPDCGRKTWPNLGVNLPAGAANMLGNWRRIPYDPLEEAVDEFLTEERQRNAGQPGR